MYKRFPTPDELRQICRTFHIGQYISTGRQLGGLFNTNLQIETSHGKYVVRVMSAYATASHLAYVIRSMRVLRRGRVPVVLPLKTKHGKYYSKLGNRYVQVARFINAISYEGEAAQIYSSGHMLRRLHRVGKTLPRGPKPMWSNKPSRTTMKRGLARLKQFKLLTEYTVVLGLYQQIEALWSKYRRHLPQTIIHGDWHLWNQLYTRDGEVCCVLDFDFMQRGERLLDVGQALWTLLSNPRTRRLATQFLKGYGPLTSHEKRALPTAIAMASLYALCTTPLMKDPILAFRYAYVRQVPFLRWLFSRNGQLTVRRLSN